MRDASILLIFLMLVLSGCSYSSVLEFYNNTPKTISICNLNLESRSCIDLMPYSSQGYHLLGDVPLEYWTIAVRVDGEVDEDIYHLTLSEELFDLASKHYCDGVLFKACNVPLQYEESGAIYWAGSESEMPVNELPNQPAGLPLVPVVAPN